MLILKINKNIILIYIYINNYYYIPRYPTNPPLVHGFTNSFNWYSFLYN
jgi:hypothetical protein